MSSTMDSIELFEFKQRLRLLALNYDSTTEFASALGISRQTVGYWLNGKRAPDADSLATISKKMGVSVDWLLGLVNVNNPTNNDSTKNISNSLGLSSATVDRLFEIADHANYGMGIMECIICNASETDHNSFLYYLFRAQHLISCAQSDSWDDAKREITPANGGVELNKREAVQYFIERAKTIFGDRKSVV